MNPHNVLLNCTYCALPALQVWLVLLPILLFTFFSLWILLRVKKSDVTMKDLLEEKDVTIQYLKMQASVAGAGTTSTASNPPQKASVSRLIALLTGLCALAIAICLTSYWIYASMTGLKPDFSNLTTVLVTLGIGVVPYTFNRLSSAMR